MRARQTRSDLGCLFSSRRLSLAQLDQQSNHDADHARNCQRFTVYVAVRPRRTGASRWKHRACACSTIRFRSTGLARYTRATRWIRDVRARERSWLLSLPVASQENLSSCIQKFAVMMPWKAWTEIDNTCHAEAKTDTTSGVGRNGAWHGTHKQHACHCVAGFCHVRIASIMVETPGEPVVENIQLVRAVSFTALAPCRPCTPKRVSF